jgi:hypothetical protein
VLLWSDAKGKRRKRFRRLGFRRSPHEIEDDQIPLKIIQRTVLSFPQGKLESFGELDKALSSYTYLKSTSKTDAGLVSRSIDPVERHLKGWQFRAWAFSLTGSGKGLGRDDDRISSGLQSVHEVDVFRALARDFLSRAERDAEDKTPKFLRELVLRISDLSGEEGVPANEPYAAFHERRKNEKALVALSSNLFERFGNDPTQREHLAKNYAELVSLRSIAKGLARQNAMARQVLRDRPVPGTAKAFLSSPEGVRNRLSFENRKALIENVKRVEFRSALTGHPTNVYQSRYLRLMLQFGAAAMEVAQDKNASAEKLRAYQDALDALHAADPVPKGNFSPFDEADMEAEALRDIYANMSLLRDNFDDALAGTGSYDADMRLSLRLNVKPLSWFMGDKDGNDKIKAEHLLRSILMHRLNVVRLYREDLEVIGAPLMRDNGEPWRDYLARLEAKLEHAFEKLEASKLGADLPLSNKDFDKFAKTLAEVFGSEDSGTLSQKFVEQLEGAFSASQDQVVQDKLIHLIDKARSFGFDFAPIELRETSEKYTNVLELLDPAYCESGNKLGHLTGLCRDPEACATRAFELLANVDALSARDYSERNTLAYHTLRRLELAARNPGAVRDMVLAECKDAANVMEALALQKIVAAMTGKKFAIPIVPLFEDLQTLEKAPQTLMNLLEQEEFRQHLLEVAGNDLSKIVLPVQIAHSDNNRLAGLPAARGGISEVHEALAGLLEGENWKKIQALFEADEAKKPFDQRAKNSLAISLEFFEGGSQTDAWRGGTRAPWSYANLFNSHKRVWQTYQGIDIFVYLQNPEAFARRVEYTLCNNAARLARGADKAKASRDVSIENGLVTALKQTARDYKELHFDAAAQFFGHPIVNSSLNGEVTNVGSRAVLKGVGDGGVTAGQHVLSDKELNKMRAIPYGNNFMAASVHPGILGAANIESNLARAFEKGSASLEALVEKSGCCEDELLDAKGGLTPKGLKELFKASPTFRDFIHFAVIAASATSLDRTLTRIEQADEAFSALRDDPYNAESNADYRQFMRDYVTKKLPIELISTSKLALGAYGFALSESDQERLKQAEALCKGKAPLSKKEAAFVAEECEYMSYCVRNVIGTAPEMGLSRNLGTFAQVARDRLITEAYRRDGKKFEESDIRTLKLLASAELAARHNSPTIAEDNALWAAMMEEEKGWRRSALIHFSPTPGEPSPVG